MELKYVHDVPLDSIVSSAIPNICNHYHGTNIGGISDSTNDNDVWMQIFKYDGHETAKVIVYDVRSERIMSITKINGTYRSWNNIVSVQQNI